MNLEEFINKIKEIKINVPDEHFFLEYNTEIYKIIEENQMLIKKYNKALQLLIDYNLPCDIDDFNTKEENIDYCFQNCSVDESVYLKCWDRFIEQELKEVK